MTGSTRRLTQRRTRLMAAAAIALMSAVAAGCGTSSSSSPSSNGSGGPVPWEDTAYPDSTDAQLTEYATKQMNGSVDVSTLAPEIKWALGVANRPLTDDQRDTLHECLSKPTCDTGTGKYTLAIVEDQVNTFYSVARAEATAYAIKTGAIKKITYTTTDLNIQEYLANFRTAIGQKSDLIISGFGGLGNQAGQVIAQAKAAGIPMTNGVAVLNDDVMSQLSVQFEAPLCDMWANGAATVAQTLKDAGKPLTYAAFTGPAGNTYAANWQPCAEKALEGAGFKKVYNGYTEWTPQGTVQAASALRASGSKPSLIIYDTFPENFMQAYMDAGDKDMPAFALSGATDVGTATTYQAAEDGGFNPVIFASPNNSWLIDIELAIDLAVKDGRGPSADKIEWPISFTPLQDVIPQTDMKANSFAFLGSPLATEDQEFALSSN